MSQAALGLLLAFGAAVALGCEDGGGASAATEIPLPAFSSSTEEAVVAAVESARDAVARSPRSARAWGRLGHVYYAHGWDDEAITCYRRAAEVEPREFRWLYFRARALEGRDPEEAEVAIERAIELGTRYPPAYLVHARVLRSLGRSEEAARQLVRLEELAPGNPHAPLMLGEIALAAGRNADARDHLLRALERNPEQSQAHRSLARVYLALGDRAAAERHAREGEKPGRSAELDDPLWEEVAAAGETRRWHAARGRELLAAGRHGEAAAELAKAVADDQATPILRLNLGIALIGSRRHAEAVPVLGRAREEAEAAGLGPDTLAMIEARLGAAHAGAGDLAAAEGAARRAHELDPASVEATLGLAIVLAMGDRIGEAVRTLEEAEHDDPRIAALRDRLLREGGTGAARARP